MTYFVAVTPAKKCYNVTMHSLKGLGCNVVTRNASFQLIQIGYYPACLLHVLYLSLQVLQRYNVVYKGFTGVTATLQDVTTTPIICALGANITG